MLLQVLRNRNLQERRDLLSPQVLELIMKFAFSTSDKYSEEQTQTGTGTSPSEIIKIELLKVCYFLPSNSEFLACDDVDRVLLSRTGRSS